MAEEKIRSVPRFHGRLCDYLNYAWTRLAYNVYCLRYAIPILESDGARMTPEYEERARS